MIKVEKENISITGKPLDVSMEFLSIVIAMREIFENDNIVRKIFRLAMEKDMKKFSDKSKKDEKSKDYSEEKIIKDFFDLMLGKKGDK